MVRRKSENGIVVVYDAFHDYPLSFGSSDGDVRFGLLLPPS